MWRHGMCLAAGTDASLPVPAAHLSGMLTHASVPSQSCGLGADESMDAAGGGGIGGEEGEQESGLLGAFALCPASPAQAGMAAGREFQDAPGEGGEDGGGRHWPSAPRWPWRVGEGGGGRERAGGCYGQIWRGGSCASAAAESGCGNVAMKGEERDGCEALQHRRCLHLLPKVPSFRKVWGRAGWEEMPKPQTGWVAHRGRRACTLPVGAPHHPRWPCEGWL